MKILLSLLIIINILFSAEKETIKIMNLLNNTQHNNPSIMKKIAKNWSSEEVKTKYHGRTDIKKDGTYKDYLPYKLSNTRGGLIGSKGKLWVYSNVDQACKIWKNIVEKNGIKLKKYHKDICKGNKKGYGAIALEVGLEDKLNNGFWSFAKFEIVSNKKIKYTSFQGRQTLYIMREQKNSEKDEINFKQAVYDNSIYNMEKILKTNSQINLDKYFYLAAEVSSLETLNFLVDSGANINYKDDSRNALNKASHDNKNIPKLKYLLSLGLKPNKKKHPIFDASGSRQIGIIKFWLNRGTDINIKDYAKKTPIFYIARNRRNIFAGITYYDTKKLLKFMIDNGANYNHKSKIGETILHIIAEHGELDQVKYISILFDDINIKGYQRRTPLHYSVMSISALNESKKYDIVKFLLASGADEDAKDSSGLTAFDYVKRNKKIRNK